jgi:hypothetical protein
MNYMVLVTTMDNQCLLRVSHKKYNDSDFEEQWDKAKISVESSPAWRKLGKMSPDAQDDNELFERTLTRMELIYKWVFKGIYYVEVDCMWQP